MSMNPTPKPNNGDFTSYIAICVSNWCRSHPRTSTNHCVDGLLETVRHLQAQKINQAMGAPPWEPDPELDAMVQETLGSKVESKPEPKPDPKPNPWQIRPVTWNDKGPIVESKLIIDLIQKLFDHGGLTEWEVKFLGDEDGKMKFAMSYPQTFFTFHSGGIFERLCYRADLQCPFHIDPGQTAPPPGWDA